MEYVRPKVELYRTRTFSEKISDTFAFIKDTWRPMMKYFVYLMLPVSIVLAFFMNNFFSGYMGVMTEVAAGGNDFDMSAIARIAGTTVGLTVCSIVAGVVLSGLVYALMRLYFRRPADDRLQTLTTAELKPELKRCMVRTLKLMGAAILIGLGFATWGGIFAVDFVLGLIGSLLQTLTFLPWYLLVVFGMVFTLQGEGGGFMGSPGYAFLQYLSCVWMCLGYLLYSVLLMVGQTIQYGHASDKIDGVGVAAGIDRFEELDTI